MSADARTLVGRSPTTTRHERNVWTIFFILRKMVEDGKPIGNPRKCALRRNSAALVYIPHVTATKNETLRHNRSTPDGKAERVDIPNTGMSCAACAKIGYATAGTARVEFIVDDRHDRPDRPSHWRSISTFVCGMNML